MKCLLVDDEPGIREGLAMLLRRRGFEVPTAADCAAAKEALGAERFDVVVTDWRLPDGFARNFVRDCTTPVIAVSGHPEEVERVDAMCAVMAKPITPTKLLECIAEHVTESAAEDDDAIEMVADVQRVVDDVRAQLPADAAVECHDDGTFVILRASLPQDATTTVRNLGGDLRLCESSRGRVLELRLCRDGRPDADVPMVRIDRPWPAVRRFALDCEGLEVSEQTFVRWLDRAAQRMAAGAEMSLVNVPESLRSATEVWETTHDMPMRERVGPRLPAELAELWS